MHSLVKIATGFAVFPALVGISGCERSKKPSLVVTGASTVYPIVQMSAEAMLENDGVVIQAQTGGSTRGFEDCINGQNELGAMARELTPEEQSQVVSFAIALDGVGIVVHQSNPLERVTTRELQEIYRKSLRSWESLGGGKEEITVVNKAEGHATLDVFLKHVALARGEVKADVVAGDNAQVLRVVGSTESAIGYVSIGEALHAMEGGSAIKLLKLDGVEPRLERIRDRTYPIFRTLYLVSKGKPGESAQKLLDFLGSEKGKEVISNCKYVPVS